MTTIKEMIRQTNADGYVDDNAEAKVHQTNRGLRFSMHFQKKWLRNRKNIFCYLAVRMMCCEQKSMMNL